MLRNVIVRRGVTRWCAAVFALAACSTPTPSDSLDLDIDGPEARADSSQDAGSARVTVDFPDGLRQVVVITPREPRKNENISVRSTLYNRSNAAMQVVARICGLDFGGTLRLTHPPEVMKCGGYSTNGSLAPGDSIVGGDLMRVAADAGSRVLTVQHAIQPARSASVTMQVRVP